MHSFSRRSVRFALAALVTFAVSSSVVGASSLDDGYSRRSFVERSFVVGRSDEFQRSFANSIGQLNSMGSKDLVTFLSDTVTFGYSPTGVELVVHRLKGSENTTRTAVIVGVVHGAEEEGRRVAEQLLTSSVPADLDLWVIPTLNPEGEAADSPKNSRGVNLNRNFPTAWEFGTHYSSGRYFGGPTAASEPETQAFMRLMYLVDPDFSVFYHAPWDEIDCDVEAAGEVCVDFAERVGLDVSFAARPGTMTDWMMSSGLGDSFVVEFGYDKISQQTIDVHVDAIFNLGL